MILFGRDARTNLDALASALDGDGFRIGLDNFVTEKRQMFLEMQGVFKKRQDNKNRQFVRQNTTIMQHFPGERGVDNRGRR